MWYVVCSRALILDRCSFAKRCECLLGVWQSGRVVNEQRDKPPRGRKYKSSSNRPQECNGSARLLCHLLPLSLTSHTHTRLPKILGSSYRGFWQQGDRGLSYTHIRKTASTSTGNADLRLLVVATRTRGTSKVSIPHFTAPTTTRYTRTEMARAMKSGVQQQRERAQMRVAYERDAGYSSVGSALFNHRDVRVRCLQ